MTTAAPHAHHGVHFGRKDIQLLAMGAGVVWALVGIFGFIPGLTQDYSSLKFLGPDSHAMLFSVFQTSMLLNIVQLVIGVVGIVMGRSAAGARRYLMWFGGLLAVLAIYGFVTGTSAANVFASTMVDNWMLIVLGLLMAGSGWYVAHNVEDQT
ncbi:DUF4383 domain-containing protein [Sinomonas sp. ASV322]|uniref:DUF4383 domain-containing protein n=1 Tax=Sinomonas sp. ASV322 TaxID=3041920 RepID=UPI0027DBCCF4|nr:DUF4383 domain-containing protein [Sinomonas sp. ASV322]MDQ4504195.1 DUF4383 domain-containing protein [Sinomonas sp. ASV322]